MANQDDPNATLAAFNAAHKDDDTTTEHFPIPGLEFLGMGYDVFGRYASVDSCTQNILDLSGAGQVEQRTLDRSPDPEILAKAFSQVPTEINEIYTRPDTVTYAPRFQIESVNEFTGDISEQITNWSTHVNVSGSYGAFGGEIDARFSSNLSKLATTKHYSLVSKSTYWQLSLAYSLENPAPLKKEVQGDLDNSAFTPEEFFDTYGTHYLSSVAIGCKVTISCEIDTSRAEADFDFGSYLKATYQGEGASVGVSADATYQNKVKRFQDYSNTNVSGVGISDDQLENIKKGTDAGVSVLKGGWHNPSLIDFPKDALKPIWDHCTDPNRKKEFKAAFEKLAANHASVISGLSFYKPLYLYRGEVNAGVTYRLYPATNLAGSADAGGSAWKIQNDGKPFINVAAKRMPEGVVPAVVPIFEWRHPPERQIWRYADRPWCAMEPDRWNNIWEQVSSEPIGWCPSFAMYPRGNFPDGVRIVYLYASPTNPWVSYYSLDELDNTRAPGEFWKRWTQGLLFNEMQAYIRHPPSSAEAEEPAAGNMFLAFSPD